MLARLPCKSNKKKYIQYNKYNKRWLLHSTIKAEIQHFNFISPFWSLKGTSYNVFIGIVHLQKKILSVFTHPHVPNGSEWLYTFRGMQEKIFYVRQLPLFMQLKSMEFKKPFFWRRIKSYRFGMTWRWVNDDRLVIFSWTISLRCALLTQRGTNSVQCPLW